MLNLKILKVSGGAFDNYLVHHCACIGHDGKEHMLNYNKRWVKSHL